jgi:hypothetical protein
MDKLLSENLSYEFFRGKVELENERVREDGKIVIERRSTLSLFDAWLRRAVRWHEEKDAMAAIVGPLRRIRRERQAPAHKLQENEYSKEFDEKQHDVFRETYLGLMNLRVVFAKHPRAPQLDVPSYLTDGKITFT